MSPKNTVLEVPLPGSVCVSQTAYYTTSSAKTFGDSDCPLPQRDADADANLRTRISVGAPLVGALFGPKPRHQDQATPRVDLSRRRRGGRPQGAPPTST